MPGYRLKQEGAVRRSVPTIPLTIPRPRTTHEGIKTTIFLEVEGAGDYLPSLSGNLDIMTAAGLKTARE